jgi:hypothetical protein
MFLRNEILASLIGVLMLVGCNRPANNAVTQVEAKAINDGWWCAEHGVPEDVCARCDISLVSAFKEKGDWCKEHERPDSQCFICHPEKQAEFAAQYEAKYGKQPPPPDKEG